MSRTATRHPATVVVQARGQARVEMILEAAAAQAAEGGLSAVTMHLVAKRAKTSVGSMYHFFPDRDSLLRTLVERHRTALHEIHARMKDIPAKTWKHLSAQEVIDHLVMPYVEYINEHPDYLAVMHGQSHPELDAEFILTLRQVLTARLPKVRAAIRNDYAAVIHAIAAGGMLFGYQANPRRAGLYLREVPQVLAAYLTHLEQLHGRAAGS